MINHYKLLEINQNQIFKKIIDFVTVIILYILILALLSGVINILLQIKSILFGTLGGGFGQIVSSVLTIFVLIDLFKTFIDFREHEEIRITYVTDATILIVMREIAAGVYAQRFDYQFILGLSTLLLILGIIRALDVKYPPKSSWELPHPLNMENFHKDTKFFMENQDFSPSSETVEIYATLEFFDKIRSSIVLRYFNKSKYFSFSGMKNSSSNFESWAYPKTIFYIQIHKNFRNTFLISDQLIISKSKF